MSEIELSTFYLEFRHTFTSYFVGLVVASFLGWITGLFISSYRPIQKPFFTIVNLIRPVPSIALIPFAILLFGIGDTARQALAIFGGVWPILFNTVFGVTNVNTAYIESGKSLGLSPLGIFIKIVIPASSPSVAAGIRTASSIILIIVISSEMIIGNYGLGAYLSKAQQSGDNFVVYYVFIFVGIMGYILNSTIEFLQNLILPWQKKHTDIL
jgi:NitT/TauT family transport system permease protein